MQQTKLILTTLLSVIMLNISAQDLANYRWKNRIVLLLTQDEDNVDFIEQKKVFEAEQEGIKERKLVFLSLLPHDELFKKYKRNDDIFEFVLIGLDGGEKWRQDSYITVEKLYTIIDGMPMRRAELRDKKTRQE